MIENYVRPYYQKLLVDAVAEKCSSRFTPNTVTALSCFMGISILPAVLLHKNWLAVGLLLLSGYFDTLDGTMARLQQKASEWGTILDILSDRLVEAVVIISLFLIDPTYYRALLTLFMFGSVLLCITSFLVIGIFTPNNSSKSFYYSPGLMERPEAFLFFGLMILFPLLFVPLAVLFSALVILTAVVRVYQYTLRV